MDEGEFEEESDLENWLGGDLVGLQRQGIQKENKFGRKDDAMISREGMFWEDSMSRLSAETHLCTQHQTSGP